MLSSITYKPNNIKTRPVGERPPPQFHLRRNFSVPRPRKPPNPGPAPTLGISHHGDRYLGQSTGRDAIARRPGLHSQSYRCHRPKTGCYRQCFGTRGQRGVFYLQPEIRSHGESNPGPGGCCQSARPTDLASFGQAKQHTKRQVKCSTATSPFYIL
jgi:hypothetical protein